MAITTPPAHNLQPESAQWGRSVNENIVELNDTATRNFANIDNTLRQVNAGLSFATQQLQHIQVSSEYKTSFATWNQGNVPNTTLTDFDATTVIFTAPSWANYVSILAFGTFGGADSATAGFGGNVKTRIHNSYSNATSYVVPNLIWSFDGTIYSQNIYDTTPAPITIPHVYGFEVAGGLEYSVAHVVSAAVIGANSVFTSQITAIVNWYQR